MKLLTSIVVGCLSIEYLHTGLFHCLPACSPDCLHAHLIDIFHVALFLLARFFNSKHFHLVHSQHDCLPCLLGFLLAHMLDHWTAYLLACLPGWFDFLIVLFHANCICLCGVPSFHDRYMGQYGYVQRGYCRSVRV